ncbi:unnamed protein product [Ilex paraguariensis]|uniref:Secreted protein n=1 Tax=Ilex paraguariensis TaxID=185542 RepID=A0ABC8UIT0_9AQUA
MYLVAGGSVGFRLRGSVVNHFFFLFNLLLGSKVTSERTWPKTLSKSSSSACLKWRRESSVLKSLPRRSPRREARRGELISPGGPQAKRT